MTKQQPKRTQSKPRKARQRKKSPPWQCEDSDLPERAPELDEASLPAGTSTAAPSEPTPSQPLDSDSAEAAGAVSDLRQSQNARCPPWQPWQDRALALQVAESRPFLAAPGPPAKAAWDALAKALLAATSKGGVQSTVDRTGDSCRARFGRLLDSQRRANLRAMQKTGTNEEVDKFIETMTELLQLYDDHEAQRKGKSGRAKAKADAEKKASLELREAAMKGMVKRQTLSDITQIEGSTQREKSAQRGRKRSASSPALSLDEDENLRPAAKRARSATRLLQSALTDHQISMSERLAEAKARDDQFRQEVSTGLASLTEGITKLSETMRMQMERDAHFRQLESEARLRDNAQMSQVIALLTTTILHSQQASHPIQAPPPSSESS